MGLASNAMVAGAVFSLGVGAFVGALAWCLWRTSQGDGGLYVDGKPQPIASAALDDDDADDDGEEGAADAAKVRPQRARGRERERRPY